MLRFALVIVMGSGNDIFHVAIFRFPKEHIEDAMTAFRQLAAASRRDPGNLGYNIYRGASGRAGEIRDAS